MRGLDDNRPGRWSYYEFLWQDLLNVVLTLDRDEVLSGSPVNGRPRRIGPIGSSTFLLFLNSSRKSNQLLSNFRTRRLFIQQFHSMVKQMLSS